MDMLLPLLKRYDLQPTSLNLDKWTPHRVGLYPGSFDPFHAGHREAVEASAAVANLDLVLLLPNLPNPSKPWRCSNEHRIAMLAREFSHHPRILVVGGSADAICRELKGLVHRVGIIGSDILQRYVERGSPPRFDADEWVVVPRVAAAVPPISQIEGRPVTLLDPASLNP